MTPNTVECPQCHSTNPATASHCLKCNASFGYDDATMGFAPPKTPQSGASATPGGSSGDALSDATMGITAPMSRPGSDGGVTTPATGVPSGWSIANPSAAAGSAAQISAGTILGTRYEIINLLGQGGMGAVYKAKDRELERLVALKVIRPEFAAQPETLHRFKQELILARQITHKNVIRIFDLGEADGIKFITMEFIEGHDLKAQMVSEGKLPYEETVRIMDQVGNALEAAHAEGVVHRDLKPQNIMLDKSGKAAVMDFGIARSIEPGAMTMTQTGMLVGTPDYMSPEQVMGEKVDARSDLFTFGVILYELLTGATPYKADSVQATMFKRTRERAKPPIEVNPEIPRILSDIATKCLEIDANLRYQSAREILQDFDAWRGGAKPAQTIAFQRPPGIALSWKTISAVVAGLVLLAVGIFIVTRSSSKPAPNGPPAVSLAIIPFHNASGDQSLDWLGSTVAEVLSTDVGESASLRMVSSERVSQMLHDLKISPDTALDPPTIQNLADLSKSDNVVWGQYARLGEQIRIDATVQNIKSGHATKVTESGAEKDIQATLDRLAGDIRKNLSLSDSSVKELQAQSFKPSTTSVPALRDYNQGLQLQRQGKLLDAVKQFDAAAQEDPNFALAFSQLAQTYSKLGQDNEAEDASRKAVALSDALPPPEKFLIQAGHDRILKDYPKAIEAYENLAKVSPNNTDVLLELGGMYEKVGAYDKALAQFTKVVELDPKRVNGILAKGRAEIESGNAQAGLDDLTHAQTLANELGNEEDRADILQAMGVAYSVLGKLDNALRSVQDSLEIKRKLGMKRGIADSLEMIGSTELALGKPDLALKNYNDALAVRKEIGDKSGTGDVLNDLGQFYSDRGQYEQALKLFKEALQVQVDVGDENQQGLALNNIGNTYLSKGDYENARIFFSQALQIREKLKFPSDIADTQHNLGDTFTGLGQYDQAIQQYLSALDLRRKSSDKRGAAFESASLGVLYGYQGRLGPALSSEEEAVKTFRDIQDHSLWYPEVLADYGNALAQVGRFDDAQKALDESVSVARELKNDARVAAAQGFLGDNLFYRGDFKAAAGLYDQSLQSAQRTTDARQTLLAKINIAKLAVKDGRYPAAAASLQKLSDDANSIGLKYLAVECSIYRGEALMNMKDYAHAQQELQSAISRSDKLGLKVLLAQSQFLLGRTLQLSGKSADAASHFKQARQLVDEIQKEAKIDTIAKRSDLAPIFAQSQ
jgi:serine/threonine protein kinase/tetratricopeptide (TPR) repeat protein